MKEGTNTRPTIGLLTDWSENPYQTALRNGVVDTAEKHNVNLICFVGGALNSSNAYEAQRNLLYKLINTNHIDGLVISAAAIGHYITPGELTEFCESFGDIPITSIAFPLASHSSILVDNSRGMQDLLDHLIIRHNYKKIAFITGPENNPEAINRYHVYKETLARHNLSFDPRLIVKGDFILKTGIKAVQILLDERKLKPQAIVAANDEMAFGALSELQSRGISIPGEMALAGFDDVEESKYYTPSLTTVRQPLYKQGQKATELLLARIAGREVPRRIYLPTELVTRESCGCMPSLMRDYTPSPPVEEITLEQFKEKGSLFSTLRNIARGYALNQELKLSPEWEEELFSAFYEDVIKEEVSGSRGSFLKILNRNLYSTEGALNITNFWQKIITVFRAETLPLLNEKGLRDRGENLWQKARVMIADVSHRHEAMLRLQVVRNSQTIRDLSEQLISTIEMPPLLDIIARQLPRMGIKSAYLSLFPESGHDELAQLVLALQDGERKTWERKALIFPSEELVPGEVPLPESRFTLMAEALFHGDEKIGFVLFEMGPRDGRIYERLRLRISNALKGTLLFQRLQSQAEYLEEEVKTRTLDLSRTNKKLHQEIVERKHAEEELTRSNQELEQFAYIASHDLQEPLRMIGSFVGLLARRYKDQIDKNANEYIEFAVNGVHRMQEMINDLLLYSRVKTRARDKEKVDLTKSLEEAIQALRFVIEESNASITYPSLPSLYADRVQIRQLFQNLISNAIKFCGENTPVITIESEDGTEEVKIGVKDKGIGIESQYLENIFVMFKRLHGKDEYPGTGIGLAICKKIIEIHDGKIWVESEPGQGSTFYFTIPKKGDNT